MFSIQKLLSPASVAVIGASSDPKKTAGRPVAYLQKNGYAGHIYPVNPKLAEINGIKCFSSIASLPHVPEVAIVLLGAERAHLAVKELSDLGVAAAIVLASGYSETGENGVLRQAQLLEAAGKMRLLGPNTIGLVNLTDGIVLSASGALEMEDLKAGNIGVVSQSGGILGSLLSRATAKGIGLSKLISTSNEVDLELSDFIDHLVDDPSTQVIALYIEAIRHAEKFRAAALRAAGMGKPIVAFKVGKSKAGAQAAVSHTGALAGSDRMYDALFKHTGVIRAQTFSDLLDISMSLASQKKLHGKRVAILTTTGGAGTLISDVLGVSGFETPPPDELTAQALRALQTGEEAVLDRNPIDVTLAGLRPDLLRGAIKILLQSPSYDALVIVVGSSSIAMPELMAGAIKDCLPLSDKPVLAYISPHAPQAAQLLTSYGVPAFAAAESIAASLLGMFHVQTWRAPVVRPSKLPHVNVAGSGNLDEFESKRLFEQFGLACTREFVVTDASQATSVAAKMKGPLVLKILSKEVLHKSEVGGVAVGLDQLTVGPRLERMKLDVQKMTGKAPEQFIVQEMVRGGTELMLGMYKDSLGTAILLGMGGVAAELLHDTSMRMLPFKGGLSSVEALEMVKELKTWPLLNGYRGKPICDVDALVKALVTFSEMVQSLNEHLLEVEINPLFVLPKGLGVVAGDGIVVLS
ncbi:MAG: acetate--CoA ligase family protein [Betaproteobacteria bacterium]